MRAAFALACSLGLAAVATLATATPPPAAPECMAAVVERPSTISGAHVTGSLHYLTGRDFNIDAHAQIDGDVFVPGTPEVFPNGCTQFAGVVDGTGSPDPADYKIHLNPNTELGHIVRRTDPVPLPSPPATVPPQGHRSVQIKKTDDDPGDFATLKDLTITGRGLELAVPPGAYGTFRVNPDNELIFGTAGATTPDLYSFENLVLNNRTQLVLAGPVDIRLKQSISIKGIVGHPDHPEWLSLSSQDCGLSLSPGASKRFAEFRRMMDCLSKNRVQ